MTMLKRTPGLCLRLALIAALLLVGPGRALAAPGGNPPLAVNDGWYQVAATGDPNGLPYWPSIDRVIQDALHPDTNPNPYPGPGGRLVTQPLTAPVMAFGRPYTYVTAFMDGYVALSDDGLNPDVEINLFRGGMSAEPGLSRVLVRAGSNAVPLTIQYVDMALLDGSDQPTGDYFSGEVNFLSDGTVALQYTRVSGPARPAGITDLASGLTVSFPPARLEKYLAVRFTPAAYSAAPAVKLTVLADQGVLANDFDPAGGTLTAAVLTAPAKGVLTLDADGGFTYTPTAGQTGPDSFTYTATASPSGLTATARVDLAIGRAAAQPANLTLTVPENGTATGAFPCAGADPDGQVVFPVLVNPPLHGVLSITANCAYTYNPDYLYAGSDRFSYALSDGVQTSPPRLVTITVTPVDEPPGTLTDGLYDLTATGQPGGPAFNWITLDGSPGAIKLTALDTTLNLGFAMPVLNPTPNAAPVSYATRVRVQDGCRLTLLDALDHEIGELDFSKDAYVYDAAFSEVYYRRGAAPDQFTLECTGLVHHWDPRLRAHVEWVFTGSGEMRLSIGGITPAPRDHLGWSLHGVTFFFPYLLLPNQATVILRPNPLVAAPNQPFTLPPGRLTGNDLDVDGGTVALVGLLPPPAGLPQQHGTTQRGPDGSVTYTPTAGFNGWSAFGYVVTSDAGLHTNHGDVYIRVGQPFSLDPLTTRTVWVDRPAAGPLPLTLPAGYTEPLQAYLESAPAHGQVTFSLDGANRLIYTYTPTPGYTGPDSFYYTVIAANGQVARAKAALNVRHVVFIPQVINP